MSSKYADCADVPCCIHAPHRQLEVSENMVLEFCDILRIYLIALQQCTEVEKKRYISSTCSSTYWQVYNNVVRQKAPSRMNGMIDYIRDFSGTSNGLLPLNRTADTEFRAQ